MRIFGHLFVFVSIILGLAVAELLSGIGDLIEHQERARISWLQLAVTGLVFLLLIQIWWGYWNNRNVRFTYLRFLIVLIPPTVLYLACKLLYPTIPQQGTINIRRSLSPHPALAFRVACLLFYCNHISEARSPEKLHL